MSFVLVNPLGILDAFLHPGGVKRNIGGIVMQCTIEEEHTDENEITEHPVEQGAAISDHIYTQPAVLTIRAGSTNADPQSGGSSQYVIELYDKLLALKASGQVFNITTGKRLYASMQFRELQVTTDQTTETTLMLRATFRQIITVETQVGSLNTQNLLNQSANGSPQNGGTQQSTYSPNQSLPDYVLQDVGS